MGQPSEVRAAGRWLAVHPVPWATADPLAEIAKVAVVIVAELVAVDSVVAVKAVADSVAATAVEVAAAIVEIAKAVVVAMAAAADSVAASKVETVAVLPVRLHLGVVVSVTLTNTSNSTKSASRNGGAFCFRIADEERPFPSRLVSILRTRHRISPLLALGSSAAELRACLLARVH
jgi:hypothetical protein